MNERDLQNQKLDRIGRKLLATAKTSDEEIEKIVAAPLLFDSIRKRIEAEKQLSRAPKSFFGDWTRVFVWNRQTAFGSLAILIVLITCASVIVYKNQSASELTNQTIKPEFQMQIQSPITQPENQPLVTEIRETKSSVTKNRPTVERAAFKIEKPKAPNLARKLNPAPSPPNAKKQTPEVFYLLSANVGWEASGEDLQIVRAELSKSELLALGVNLPLEIESVKVKTDLLVSADGVARAIKFVE